MVVAKEINDARPHCIEKEAPKELGQWKTGFIFTRSLSPNSNH